MSSKRPTILTFTHKMVNPLALKPADIDILDIAHALSMLNRFCGHTAFPINIAQHSVYVAKLVDPPLKLAALLHDASEAYLGDVTRWVKAHPAMMGYRLAEDAAMLAVMKKFGFTTNQLLHTQVRDADNLMVRFEGSMAYRPERWWEQCRFPPCTSEEIQRVLPWEPWGWMESRERFIQAFEEIAGVNVERAGLYHPAMGERPSVAANRAEG